MPDPFESRNEVEELDNRLTTIKAELEEQAGHARIFNEAERAKMRAISSIVSSIDVESSDAMGKIGLIERALHIKTRVERGRTLQGSIQDLEMKFIDSSESSRVQSILASLHQVFGIIDQLKPEGQSKMLEILQRLEALDPQAEDLNKQLAEIEQELNFVSSERGKQGEVTDSAPSGVTRSFEDAFAPRDLVAGYRERIAAVSEKLLQQEAMSDILSDETRATMLEISRVLEAMDVSSEEAVGKIGMLEAALNIRPRVTRRGRGRA